MHELRAALGCRARDGRGASRLNRLEGLSSFFVKDTDEVDERVCSLRRTLDGILNAQICLHRVDLADAAKRLQVICEIRAPYRDADTPAALGKRAHHVAADEAGAAIDRNQTILRNRRHLDPLLKPAGLQTSERYSMARLS
jgi:hypothetical protein